MNIRELSFIAVMIASARLISVAGAPVPDGGRLEGILTDPSGAGIGGAFILIHWDPAGASVGLRTNVGIASDLTVHTGLDGRFSVALPPGFYDILFSASAFSPKARKLRILPGSRLKSNVELELDVGVTDALADKFK